ncbi:MAG: hypothetical protein H6707_00965 [Deltaproteobacteria bacterium]|nr:hypothetical protein [Deltaproteobacteria bacterium]
MARDNKATVAIVLLLLAGAAIALFLLLKKPHPYAAACQRVNHLCHTNLRLERCEADFSKLRDLIGEKDALEAAQCVERADSCMAIAGCAAGAGSAALGQIVGGVVGRVGPKVLEGALKLAKGIERATAKVPQAIDRVTKAVDRNIDRATEASKQAIDKTAAALDRTGQAVDQTISGAAAAFDRKFARAEKEIEAALKHVDREIAKTERAIDQAGREISKKGNEISAQVDRSLSYAWDAFERAKNGLGLSDDQAKNKSHKQAVIERLERAVADIREAVVKGQLAVAKLRLIDVAWIPGTCSDKVEDAAMTRYYDKKRQALAAIIESTGRSSTP